MDVNKAIKHNIAEDFWIKKLEAIPDQTLLCQNYHDFKNIEAKRKDYEEDFSEKLSALLNNVSKYNSASAYVILVSALTILVNKYSGSDDLLIGSTPPKTVRTTENEDVLLFFRTSASKNISPKDLIKDILQQLNAGAKHNQYDFHQLVRRLNYHNQEENLNLTRPLQYGIVYTAFNATSKLGEDFELLFTVKNINDSFGIHVRYNVRQYTQKQIKQLTRHFIGILSCILEDPSIPVAQIDMLHEDERRELLVDFNDAKSFRRSERTVVELWRDQVKKTPNHTALVFGDVRLTYQEVDHKSEKLAIHLCSRYDVCRDDRIGLMVDRSERWIIALLAILKSGACYVPIDPQYPAVRIAHMLGETNVKALLTDADHVYAAMEYYKGNVVALDLELEGLPIKPDVKTPDKSKVCDLAYIMYTSGSTGQPKGVMVEHKSIVRLVKSPNYFQFGTGQKILQTGSLSFDAMTFEVWGALLNGGELHLLSTNDLLDFTTLKNKILTDQIDAVWFTSSWFNQIVDTDLSILTGLKAILVGGEKLSPKHINKVRKTFPDLKIINGYGPTENTTFSTAFLIDREYEYSIPIGRPISNSQVYILDQNRSLLPKGATGEIYLGGEGLARGYWNHPQLTAEKFIECPFREGEKLYKTGDLGCWLEEGVVEFLGRKDRQVKLRGYRIELGEIEAAALKYPNILSAAVVLKKTSDDQDILAAYYVASQNIDIRNYTSFLLENLPSYMIPTHFIQLDKFPLTENGKLDVEALPHPEGMNMSVAAYEAPQTELQKALVEIWREVLKVDKIGINDNFFILGGDSIKGIRVANKILERLNEIVHVAILFEAPTIKELSNNLASYQNNVDHEIGQKEIDRLRKIITPLQPFENKKEKNPGALFLLSPPRAGSTLLRSILAGHPDLFSPPELELLGFNTLVERKKEFSGKFSFYAEGVIRAVMQLFNIPAEEAIGFVQSYEDKNCSIQEFYNVLQQNLNGRLLVDKSPFYSLDLEILRRAEAYFDKPFYIHLQRNPYGVVNSFEEAKIDQIFRYDHPFTTRELAELVYIVSVQNINAFLENIPEARKYVVKYEDLTTDPSSAVQGICQFLGIDYNNSMLDLYEKPEARMMDGIYPESKTIGDIKILTHSKINSLSVNKWRGKYKEEFLGETARAAAKFLGYADEDLRLENNNIKQVPEAEYYDLSHAQKRLWLLSQMEEASQAYNSPKAYVLEGDLDHNVFFKVFDTLIQRHESLRTTFPLVNGEVKQKVNSAAEYGFRVDYEDLRSYKDWENKAMSEAENQLKTAMDLAKGPLVKAKLLQIGDKKYIFLMTMHHIVTDGWSMGLFVKEIVTLCDAFRKGHKNPLPPLKIQYKDYAAWQNSQLKEGIYQKHKSYWAQQLKGELPVLDLPADYARPATKSYRGERMVITLNERQKHGLYRVGQKIGASLFMVLLGTVKTLLYRYTNQSDIVIGFPIAGREHPDLEEQIGFYVNTLAIRTQVSGEDSFQQVLEEIKKNVIEAYAHQAYPFDKLIEDLPIEMDKSRSPLFDVAVVLQNTEAIGKEELEIENLKVFEYNPDINISKFDLSFTYIELDKGLAVVVDYNLDLFKKRRIERLIKHYINLVNSAIANSEISLSKLNMMDVEESSLIKSFSIGKSRAYPKDRTIAQLFEEQSDLHPKAPAIVYEGQTTTYEELNNKANGLARYLQKNVAIDADTSVGIMIDRSDLMIIGLLGIIKAGACYVPIDPEYPEERIRFILSDAGIDLLLTDSTRMFQIGESYEGKLFALDIQLQNIESDPKNLNLDILPDHLIYTIYTSGSTGNPKGVMATNQGLTNLCYWHIDAFKVNRHSKATVYSGIGFDACAWEIWPYLLSGACLYPLKNDIRLNINGVIDFVNKRAITHCFLPTPVCDQLNRMENQPLHDKVVILTGGDRLNKTASGNYILVNNYGPTETTVVASSTVVASDDKDIISIGKPIFNARIYIVDDAFNVMPIGVKGEICIGGDGLARGYLNDTHQTEEKFVKHPETGERIYKTNDLGRWLEDGNIEFIGRRDAQVKIRGHRIEIGEIEVVFQGYPEVAEAAVVLHNYDAGEKKLTAYFTATRQIDSGELRNYLSKSLPAYMIPSYFIQLDRLPLTTHGKIDRHALPEPQELGAPTGSQFIGPRDHIDESLIKIWRKVLNREKIGISDNFFELGGHSIKGMQVIAQIFQEFDVKIELGNLFVFSTIRELSDIVRSAAPESGEIIPAIDEAPYYDVSHAQKQIWFSCQNEDSNLAYNIPKAYACSGPMNYQALIDAFKGVIQRHESLRTTFHSVGGELKQKIHDAETMKFTINHVDLRNEVAKDDKMHELIARASRTLFDLENGPLVRASIIQTEEEYSIFLFTIHHIIADGWSMEVIMHDLFKLYRAFQEGKENPLLPIKIQYKDFAAWHNNKLKDTAIDESRSYWLKQFKDGVPPLNLPLDFLRPLHRTFNGNRKTFFIDSEITEGLHKISERYGASLFMTLLGSVKALLYKYSGQADIVLGSPIAGRDNPLLENQVGIFLNTLAIRTQLKGNSGFGDYLKVVKSKVIEAYDHQIYPFDLLLEELNFERQTSRSPLFDVMVAFQNNIKFLKESETLSSRLQIEEFRGDFDISKFDLTVSFFEIEEGISCTFEYNNDLFKESSIDRFARHYLNLLQAILQNPDRPLDELQLMGEDEINRILSYNNTQTAYPKDAAIQQLFEDQARKRPVAKAVISENRSLSYDQLNRKANQLAHYLIDNYHVKPNEPVGLIMERSEMFVIGILGILKAGGAYVPIDTEFPNLSAQYMINDSAARFILCSEEYIDFKMNKASTINLNGSWNKINKYSQKNPTFKNTSRDIAYIMYTSGSTGKPKGVAVEHRSIARLLINTNYINIKKGANLLQTGALSFDAATFEIWGMLLKGGSLHILPHSSLMDVDALRRKMINDIDIVWFTSSWFNELVDTDINIFSNLKYLLIGGDRLSVRHVNKIREAFPDLRVINGYGPTENTTFSLCHFIDRNYPASIPIGKPISNSSVFILDKNLQLTPEGIIGEIYLGGDGLARGYWNKPELTKEKFIKVPVEGKTFLLYRSGDLGRWNENGEVEFFGRNDNQIKRRGFRVEVEAIENEIKSFNGVLNASILQKPRKEDLDLIAFYTGEAKKEQLYKYLKENLPFYMMPDRLVLVEKFPLTANGKINKNELASMADNEAEREFSNDEAPQTNLETAMREIWADILQREHIGTYDNFFELGGHSLKALRLISKIYERFDVKIYIKTIFDNPTIKKLAEVMQKADKRKFEPIQSAALQTYYPLSHAQKRLWLLSQFEDQQGVYNVSASFMITEAIDIDLFIKAVETLVERHEILRTIIVTVKGEPYQQILSFQSSDFRVRQTDISDEKNNENLALELTNKAANLSFDLSATPPLHVELLKLNHDRYLLLITMHHIISDGWSMEIIGNEIQTLYNAFKYGKPNPIKPLRIQYKDYAVWQQKQLSENGSGIHRDYWLSLLSDGVPVLNLPTDYERPAVKTFNGGKVEFILNDTVVKRLRKTCESNGTSIFMAVLSSLYALLYRYTDQKDLIIGSPIAGRDHPDLENQIGFYINMLALRLHIEEKCNFLQLLTDAKKVVLDAFSHKSYPFDCLIDELQIQRDLSRSILFDVGFTWHQRSLDFNHTQIDGIRAEEFKSDFQVAKADIWFHGLELETNEILMYAEYNTDLFEEETLFIMLQKLEKLLESSLSDLYLPLQDIDLELETESRLKSQADPVRFSFGE